jgi:RHS repeat-associated protein
LEHQKAGRPETTAPTENAVTWVHEEPTTKGKRLTDSNGTVVSATEVDPFGGWTDRGMNLDFQPRHFTTYERDTVGGMDEAMARRYHGWWSRFSQPDPYDGSYSLADPQSFNRYSYVQSDPVSFTDPSGMCLAVQFMDPVTQRTWWEFHLCNDATTRHGGGGGGADGGGGGWTPPNATSTQTEGQPLSDCVKKILARYLPREVLDEIRVHTDGLPTLVDLTKYITGPKGAYTSGNDVYFPEGQYDPFSSSGISEIGHEVTHSVQYAKLGNTAFRLLYAQGFYDNLTVLSGLIEGPTKAYEKIQAEKAASAVGLFILDDLRKRFGNENPCP